MTTIIAASDLSDRSREVPGRAVSIAAAIGARVALVHVTASGAPALRSEDARQRLQLQLEELAMPAPVEIEIRILSGRPELEIPSLAQEVDAELIVIGLHRPRRVLDVLRLTTLERIALRAAQPVLIAHTPASGPYRKVLAATDFSPACAAALAAAARLAPQAEFHAIHALQVPLFDKFSAQAVETSSAMTQAEALRDAFLRMPGVPVKLHEPEIVAGGVHQVLDYLIEDMRPDLLTIGSHSGRDPSTLGNYARDLMREPPIDVLVAKPPAARNAGRSAVANESA